MSSPAATTDPLPHLLEISNLLNTGLSEEALVALQALIAAGATPEALVAVVQEMRKEAAENEANETKTTK